MVHKDEVEFEADPKESLAIIEGVTTFVSQFEDHRLSLLVPKVKLTLAKIYASVGR